MRLASVLGGVSVAIAALGFPGWTHVPDAPPENRLGAGDVRTVEATEWRRINDRLFKAPETDLRTVAMRAYVWGMPLMHQAMMMESLGKGDAQRPPAMMNRFSHTRALADARSRIGVGVNNDTIYSLVWIDLRDGPVILTAPNFGDRYYTFSMNFADTSAEQSLGQRTHGGQLPPVFIQGPDYAGPAPPGMAIVASPTRFLNIAGRILVRSPADYAAVHALQDKIALTSWAAWQDGRKDPPEARPPPRLTVPGEPLPPNLEFLARLNRILQEWVVLPRDRAIVTSFAELGIGPGHIYKPQDLSPDELANINRGIEEGRRLVAARSLQLGVQRNGWTINYSGPRFGTDYLLRAGVAKDQPNVAIPEEALYPLARVDAEGRALDGRHSYQIHFPPGQTPPVDAFWSVTAYDNEGAMMPNPANVYSVGDRTANLVRDADGGLTIRIAAKVSEGPASNWLPVATSGPFYLMLRLYRPRPAVLSREWVPPAIRRLD